MSIRASFLFSLTALVAVGALAGGAPASAATYFTDFGEYSTGAAPSDWTKTRDLGTATWTVEAVTGAGEGKVLRGDNAVTGYSLFTWNDPNGDAGRANSEVVIKWRTTTLQDNSTAGVGALVRAQSDFTNGYQAWARNQATSQLGLQKNSGFNLGSANFSWSNSTWYMTRLRANGTSIQTKIWAASDSEPGSWTLTATDSGIADGPIGVAISNATGVYEFDYVGIGTNGDTAPTSSGGTPNSAPGAPSLDSPASGATALSTTPTFKMTATDPDADALQYKLAIYSDSGCTTEVQNNSQASSQSGWSGQDATCSAGSDCYDSGSQATYQLQSPLSYSTTYYWKPGVKDPLGTNAFVDSSSCRSFTTAAASNDGTNISSNASEHWAWNDLIGWIDFYGTDNVVVSSSGLEGYADSSLGEVSLDCETSPAGDICGQAQYQALNDGSGRLSGWAWNDVVGWISLCGGLGTSACPGDVSYRVLIDGATGDFTGYAWNDVVGWISFSCVGPPNHCGTSQYEVKTTWAATSTTGYVDSSTFDTGITGGAQINSILWQGSMPSPVNGSFVGFQFAVSNSSSGPWSYKGPDGTSSSYYGTAVGEGPDVSIPVSYTLHHNARYFRYRVVLSSTADQSASPRVDSISVNWSR